VIAHVKKAALDLSPVISPAFTDFAYTPHPIDKQTAPGGVGQYPFGAELTWEWVGGVGKVQNGVHSNNVKASCQLDRSASGGSYCMLPNLLQAVFQESRNGRPGSRVFNQPSFDDFSHIREFIKCCRPWLVSSTSDFGWFRVLVTLAGFGY
jgi:hypothetical protein